MKKLNLLPFYSIKNNSLLYLNEYKICELPKNEKCKKWILKNEGALFTSLKKENKEETILVIEPHPDDFALSALGYTIDRFNTIVLDIFSKTDLKNFTWIDKINMDSNTYEQIRIKESEFAVKKLLGQRFLSLREESTKITNKKQLKIENRIIGHTNKVLNNNTNIDTILVPMGIGGHSDHMMAYTTIMNTYSRNKKFNIVLYPEYPYARCRKNYNARLNEIKKRFKIKPIVIDVEDKIEILADVVSIYRSQFDDINRNQMLAIIREDCRAIASEYNKEHLSLVYYEVEEAINEN